ncbi:MAG: SGNH/GDSL hydrolase family protein [Gemmatimonas sp.]
MHITPAMLGWKMFAVTGGCKDVKAEPEEAPEKLPVATRYKGPFARYVAIGDSTTEGLDDPDGQGGYRGWANRFAELVAAEQGRLLYANLAVRGLRTRAILERQLERALHMKPDLSTLVSGTNDILRPRFNVNAYQRDVEHMQCALIGQGATVLTFTLPDLSSINPSARISKRRVSMMNAALREVSSSTGAIVVDLAQQVLAGDKRLWSVDRLHANALGHARIAAALADALRLPGSDDSWSLPLEHSPPMSTREQWADHWYWSRRYLLPWLIRRLQGRSSSEGVKCKRPELTPIDPIRI